MNKTAFLSIHKPVPGLGFLFAFLAACQLPAAVSVTNLFGDHMVLQRGGPVAVFGRAEAGEGVTVSIAGQTVGTVANAAGDWKVSLPAMEAGGPHQLVITASNELVFEDVLVGEVWIASGQSNMQWPVKRSLNADLEELAAVRNPAIRYLPVKNMGSQEPQREIPGEWTLTNPETMQDFSAVAYAFAETLHEVLGVPVGIIENAWGGSSAEAWVPRPVIAADPVLRPYHEHWLEIEDGYDYEAELEQWKADLAAWEAEKAKATPGDEIPGRPRKPREKMYTQHRPGNLWNARVLPVAPYTVRGVIWYQGEANAGRAMEYRTLFPTLIREWRGLWETGFPFYWVQLADFRQEAVIGQDDPWPVLREAQTLTLETVPNTGQAVIIDLGEGRDIHPRHKEEVGRRLARWALNRDYGYADLVCRSPEFDSFRQDGDQLVVNFNYTGSGLRAFDTATVHGFVINTGTGGWQPVEGTVQSGDTVVLDLPDETPVLDIRYAWANNPVCNLFSIEGLPATPFRSDRP